MPAWRMAFRAGTNGHELWPDCKRLCVAAIEYQPMDDLNLGQYPRGEPKSAWAQLAPSQRNSLNRFVHEMADGDVIYVKQGMVIVGRGVVRGSYHFDAKDRIREPGGVSWQHQRRVEWDRTFPEVSIRIGRPQVVTLVPLTDEDVSRVEQAASHCFAEVSDLEGTLTETVQLGRKRSRKLREAALKAANGVCSACEKDFSRVLGGRGKRVLQVHHRQQLSSRDKPAVNTIRQLAVVCANCHLLLHIDPRVAMRVEDLREELKADEPR